MQDKNKDVAILTNAFREEKLIKNCIKQFKNYNLFHIVLAPNKSWNAGLQQDDTPALAKKYGADLVIEGDFKTEAQQFNYGLNLLRDYKYVWIVDADERYLQKDIRTNLETFKNAQGDVIKINNMPVYWKTRDYEIVPAQRDDPIIAVKPHINFVKARSAEYKSASWIVERMYHLSYVRSDEDMLKKIKTFSHADEFDLLEWYSNKWLSWTTDMTDLHPVVPPQFKMAVYNPLPEEIKV